MTEQHTERDQSAMNAQERRSVAQDADEWECEDGAFGDPMSNPANRRPYTDADAWRENYEGMAARWAECDAERLRLKQELADANLRLRLLDEQRLSSGGSDE